MILQDKIKSRGKADACRGFLTKYCGIRSGLERINPYGSPPFAVGFLFVNQTGSASFSARAWAIFFFIARIMGIASKIVSTSATAWTVAMPYAPKIHAMG